MDADLTTRAGMGGLVLAWSTLAALIALRIGWVLPRWDDELRQRAIELEASYLFVDRQFCPDEAAHLWPGDWQWVAYTLNQPEQVARCAGLGIELIETDRFSELATESDIVEVSTDF